MYAKEISIVIPPLFFNKDSIGYNEMLASELKAVISSYRIIKSSICIERPNEKADIYILAVQYRDDVFSGWMTQTIKECHQLGGIVFVCGKSASVEYRYLLKYVNANFVFMGEAEETLENIIEIAITKKKVKYEDFYGIKGIAYLFENEIIKYKRLLKKSLDDLPMPQYEYISSREVKYPICVMETSRSCHGKCNFCEGCLFRNFTGENEYRVKSPERVVDELKYVIQTYGTRVFSFADDNFFADGHRGKQRAIEIADLIIKNHLKNRFTIECRADDVDYEIFKNLKKAGLIKVFVGIESGSQAVLDRYNKGTTVDVNRNAIDILNSLNIQCHPGYILFDPKTTLSELQETVAFFEPYLDSLFSFKEGYDNRLLYYPQGCPIVNDFWPNQTEEFYEKVWYQGVECLYEDEKTAAVYEKFSEMMSDSQMFSGSNMLKRRIYCLKKALIEV